MNDLRTAAQQALEALGSSLYPQPRQMAAIAALKAALAEHFCDTHCTWADHAPGCVRAEPTQEPVAWMDREGDLYKMPEIEGWAPPHTMLYAAPPQRKPLTEEEMRMLGGAAFGIDITLDGNLMAFGRAVERAHRIKE